MQLSAMTMSVPNSQETHEDGIRVKYYERIFSGILIPYEALTIGEMIGQGIATACVSVCDHHVLLIQRKIIVSC